MRLIALRPLTGDYGQVNDGQEFEASEKVSESLVRRGLARPYIEAKAITGSPENKMLAESPENKSEAPTKPPIQQPKKTK